jgi:radical SAM superfamily enzyme YgiQ (UPF0313 family)
MLRDQGHEVKIVDMETIQIPTNRYLEEADVFGVSVKVNTFYEAKRITKEYKAKFPNTKIIWGGPMITYNLDRCKEDVPEVDEFYTGLASELTGITDFKEYPRPDYTLLDTFKIWEYRWRTGQYRYPIMTSIGCPYQCTYCNHEKKYVYREAEDCFEELRDAQKNFGIQVFMPMDDNFNMIKKRLIKFCELIKPLGLHWTCTNGLRANLFDDDVAIALKSAGCHRFSFGIESTDAEVLKKVKKGETLEVIEKAIKIGHKHGFAINGYFIIGLPESTPEKDRKSWEWAKEMGIDYHFGILVCFPGTELYDEFKDNIIGDPFNALFFGDDLEVTYETKDYTAKQRLALYNEIWSEKKNGK